MVGAMLGRVALAPTETREHAASEAMLSKLPWRREWTCSSSVFRSSPRNSSGGLRARVWVRRSSAAHTSLHGVFLATEVARRPALLPSPITINLGPWSIARAASRRLGPFIMPHRRTFAAATNAAASWRKATTKVLPQRGKPSILQPIERPDNRCEVTFICAKTGRFSTSTSPCTSLQRWFPPMDRAICASSEEWRLFALSPLSLVHLCASNFEKKHYLGCYERL